MKITERIHLLNPRPKERIGYHLLFWLVLFALRLYLTAITFNVYSGFAVTEVMLLNLCSTALVAAVYYLLTGPLWHWAGKGRWGIAIPGIILAIIVYTVLDAGFEQMILSTCANCLVILKAHQVDYYGLLQSGMINIVLKRLLSLGTPFMLLLTLSIPLCIKLALNSWRSQVNALQLAKQNIELEFNFLKSQVNPHFLFNTMNNIYGLIIQEDTIRSAAMVARLSGLLRYMLYETNESYLPLDREIKLLQDYTALEKVRLNDTVVKTAISTDAGDYTMPPLLLVPLLENAFKFCSDGPGAYIDLFLDVLQGRLRFTLDNTVEPGRTAESGRGIGLANFRKRLEMYYPGRHSYEISLQDSVYSVHLSIDLL
ncbi:sensor histidine kinase [Mucilaginibacter segetis]|uniref:Histidine kinase n=1 Tax=Mucilaginibacter segetis TaxID=2793071 RepID=A0A934PTN7_9SPHI|nr:sensor histidine kinase [Mucilaginibacter segetis]MBK0379215.1 histidine kinase [Mucilaginibacter segetis]